MKQLLLTILYFTACSTSSNEVEKVQTSKDTLSQVTRKGNDISDSNFISKSKVEILTLNYNAISCSCAQWSEAKFNNNPDKRIYYWLEPANEKLVNADTLFNGDNLPVQIKVSGQIVSEKGFSKGLDLSKVGQDEAGKVFRYTKIEVLQSGQKKNGY